MEVMEAMALRADDRLMHLQLYGRGLGCLRVVLLRDGRSLPHLRWLLQNGGVAGTGTTPHSRLPMIGSPFLMLKLAPPSLLKYGCCRQRLS